MRGYWGQPSLSRDFALLSAAVFFLLCLISAWVIYSTYQKNAERITGELGKEATRIERMLSKEMDSANFMLQALGKQVVADSERDLIRIAHMLKSFDSKSYIYAVLTFVDPDENIIVSSNRGILDKPVSAADRDYVKRTYLEPWKMQIGRPVEGHVSNRWVVPVAMGLTDSTGKFIGTLVISLNISMLTEQISGMVKREGISFAIVSKTLIALTQVSEDKDFVTNNFPAQKLQDVDFQKNPSGLLTLGSLFWATGNYAYYKVSSDYPYVILLGYDPHFSDVTVRNVLISRLVQMMLIAVFFVLFLWVMRIKMIKPVLEMTATAAQVGSGKTQVEYPKAGGVEIEGLAGQIRRIGQYIDENKRLEDELRNKVQMLSRARSDAEIVARSRTERLACICQEMQGRLSQMVSAAQKIKEEQFGKLSNQQYVESAGELYQAGSILFEELRNTLVLAKMETDYLKLAEKPVDLAQVSAKTLRFLADKMQALRVNVQVNLPEPMPRLLGDEMRVQQIFMNLLLYLFESAKQDSTLLIEGRIISEQKERLCLALTFTTDNQSPYSNEELVALASKLMNTPEYSNGKHYEFISDLNIGLELAKVLVRAHRGYMEVHQQGARTSITLLFAASRIRFMDSYDI